MRPHRPCSLALCLGLVVSSTIAAVQKKGEDQEHKQAKEAITKLRGARILLVEDNEINQELALELLISAGLTVEVAVNGQEALDLLSHEEVDGVLMDCHMPAMDGYTATREIRKQPQFKDLPVYTADGTGLKY